MPGIKPALAEEIIAPANLAISDEYSGGPAEPADEPPSDTPTFNTGGGSSGSGPSAAVVIDSQAISDEQSFASPPALPSLALSNEISFSTAGSGENSFFTLPLAAGGPSGENTFTTPSSGENTFTTLPESGGPGGGGPTGGGGGGGGGSSGGGFGGVQVIPPVPPAIISPPPGCPLFLREFIHIGRANNPVEVRKLQAFLNVFQGEHLPITGFYSQADFDAVSRFQRQYLPDVLTPWGINESTGYVFITTRLAINNVYCTRSTAHDLDLRNFYPEIYATIVREPGTEIIVEGQATTTATTTPLSAIGRFFQAAALGLLNLFQFGSCELLIFLLVLAILFLLLLVWRLSRYPDVGGSSPGDHFYPSTAGPPADEAGSPPEEEVIVDDDTLGASETTDHDPTQPPLDPVIRE